MITSDLIRKAAAEKWGCPVMKIVWGLCLKLAKDEKMDKTVKYTTARGSNVECTIKTTEKNLADHRVSQDCYKFEIKLNGKAFGAFKIKDGCFKTRFPQTTNGKKTHFLIPSTPEALALYEEYKAESDRHFEAWKNNENDYQKHCEKMNVAMAE
jgi:predicted DNA binding protein